MLCIIISIMSMILITEEVHKKLKEMKEKYQKRYPELKVTYSYLIKKGLEALERAHNG